LFSIKLVPNIGGFNGRSVVQWHFTGKTHVDGHCKVSYEFMNPTIYLVYDGEASNK